MTPKNKKNNGKGNKLCSFVLAFLLIAFPVSAIEWTYYDLDNQILQDPTEEEIQETAVMRISDTGVTQYSLEIDHDFSGTWGTGYLENIGNPMPGVGKHWMNINENVTCKVDGIVQDVYNLNSRYVANGYFAQGPPNSDDKAAALIFDGSNDYVAISDVLIKYPSSITIKLWAKRDRLNVEERLFAHVDGIYAGFDSNNKAVFGTSSEECQADVTTDTGWHKWEFKLVFYKKPYYDVTGRGYEMWIYMDDVQIGYKKIEPDCWSETKYYEGTETVTGCNWFELSNYETAGENDEPNNEGFGTCKDLWGENAIKGDKPHELHIQLCYDFNNNRRNHEIGYCDKCYKPKYWMGEADCRGSWKDRGYHHPNTGYPHDNEWMEMYNYFDYRDLLITKEYPATKSYKEYHAHWSYYYLNRTFNIGRSYTNKYFQGKIKDVRLYQSGKKVGRWKLNDGDKSSVAVDSWKYRNGNLKNFDTDTCWLILNAMILKSF